MAEYKNKKSSVEVGIREYDEITSQMASKKRAVAPTRKQADALTQAQERAAEKRAAEGRTAEKRGADKEKK